MECSLFTSNSIYFPVRTSDWSGPTNITYYHLLWNYNTLILTELGLTVSRFSLSDVVTEKEKKSPKTCHRKKRKKISKNVAHTGVRAIGQGWRQPHFSPFKFPYLAITLRSVRTGLVRVP
jgi:hypothetical protein